MDGGDDAGGSCNRHPRRRPLAQHGLLRSVSGSPCPDLSHTDPLHHRPLQAPVVDDIPRGAEKRLQHRDEEMPRCAAVLILRPSAADVHPAQNKEDRPHQRQFRNLARLPRVEPVPSPLEYVVKVH